MDTNGTPLAPGTLLLVRFVAHAEKRLGRPGAAYWSRQRTTLHIGEVVEVIEDTGRGYMTAHRGGKGDVYRVHASDLMLKPTDEQIARDAIELVRARAERDGAFDALRLAEAEVAALKAKLAQRDVEIDQVIAQRNALQTVVSSLHERAVRATEALGVVFAPAE